MLIASRHPMRDRRKNLFAAALLLLVLLVLFRWWRERPLSAGPPLGIGKVEPQLVSAWDMASLLAPDGSLWVWGGTESGLVDLFGKTNVNTVPQRVTPDTDWQKIAGNANHMLALK